MTKHWAAFARLTSWCVNKFGNWVWGIATRKKGFEISHQFQNLNNLH
jgi:hypothetical protein